VILHLTKEPLSLSVRTGTSPMLRRLAFWSVWLSRRRPPLWRMISVC